MKFKKLVIMEVAVGIFSFAAIFALLAMTTVLSEEMFFRTYDTIDVVFESVSGLGVGNEVSARGVPIGKVKRIFLADEGVHVVARIDVPLKLREDYRIEIRRGSVLGGSFLCIDEGSPSAKRLSSDGVLRGAPASDMMEAAAQTLRDVQQALNDGILEDVKTSMANIRKATGQLGDGGGTIGRLLEDDRLYEDVQQLAANARTISETIVRGEGTIGRLVMDDAIYRDLQAIATNVGGISDKLAKGEGTVGQLLADDGQVSKDLAATVAEIRGIAESVGRGEGSLGKLLADEALYLELQSLLREGRAALDDVRETSPITTFTSIFFGAF